MSDFDRGSNYDRWLTTDTRQDTHEQAHAAFDQSDDYLNAYVDYCEVFDQSAHYDKAYERWVSGLDDEDDFGPDEADEYDERVRAYDDNFEVDL